MTKEELARINEVIGNVNNAVSEIEQLETARSKVETIVFDEKFLKDENTPKLYVDMYSRTGIQKIGLYNYLDSDTILVIKNALIKCIDNRISLNKKLIDETNYIRINKIRRYGK